MGYFNCLDVSEHNGNIDWDAAKADGVEYALIRCGFGKDYESQDDKYFDINMKNALAAGVKVGVYFYSYAQNVEAAASEAVHCLRLIEPYKNKLSLPVFYDVEENSIINAVADTIPVFTQMLNEAGYNVGVYATGYWFTHYLQYVAIDYLWVAYWGNDDGEPHSKPEWCDIWQYTSRGSVDGVGSGGVDCNILYNTQMTALINGGSDDKDDDKKDDDKGGDVVNVELNVLRKGDKGNQVETLQILLNAFGFRDQNGEKLAVDSIFGSKTEYAVKSYQRARGLGVDGIVGVKTWNRILK